MLPRGPEGSEDPGLAGLQYSHGSLWVSGSMRHRTNLGQGFCQACKAPGDPDQEGSGFCLGPRTESFHGGLEAGDHYSPMSLANRLFFPPMHYPAVDSSCITTGFILLQLGEDNKWYPSQFVSIGTRGNPTTLRLKLKSTV